MKKPIKYLLIACAAIVAFFAYMTLDWYRFATSAEIDPKRGVYGNDHLEIWIDINARMPEAMRLWACQTLREREKTVLGGQNTMPFYSCQPDFGKYASPSSQSESVINAMAHSAIFRAEQKNATDEQKNKVRTCMINALNAALTVEQKEALNADAPDKDALLLLNKAGHAASDGCLSNAGIN